MTSVLIVDDHPVFRRGLAVLLGSAGYRVCAEAASGEEAVELAAADPPDLVLMDLALPGMNGADATARIVAGRRPPRVVMLTMDDSARSLRECLAAGAVGYVLKDAPGEQILGALAAVLAGATVLGAGVALAAPATPAADDGRGLTGREREVADLLARGLPNQMIAARLGVSAKTVANYVAALRLKLGAGSRHEAARIWRGR